MKSLMRSGHRLPGLVDDAEDRVAVLDAGGHHAQGDEVVHLVEVDALPVQLQVDAVQALDAAVDGDDGHLRFGELGEDGAAQFLDQPLGRAPALVDLVAQFLVGAGFERLEGQFLELVLDLAHAQPVGDGRVDVEGLPGDALPLLVGDVPEGAHVVEAVGELDEDDADVVHHRQEHAPEVLGLLGLLGREGDAGELGDALDDVGDFGTEELGDPVDGGEGVLDHVMEQAGGHRHGVQSHVDQEVGDLQGMDEVGFARVANLPLVLPGREHVRPPEQLEIGVGAIAADLVDQVLEPNHGAWCLTDVTGDRMLVDHSPRAP